MREWGGASKLVWSPHLVDLRLERFEIKLQELLQSVVFIGVQRITQLPALKHTDTGETRREAGGSEGES